MEFIPLYYKEKLDVINRWGDVGVVSLWSPWKVVKKRFAEVPVDLNPETSRIAVFGTLYGDGLPELLRNLLYNPQLRYLVLCGVDLGRSRDSVLGFFHRGLEWTTCLGASVQQIIGTLQKIDGAIQPEMFHDHLTVVDLGTPGASDALEKIGQFFAHLPPQESVDRERQTIPLSSLVLTRYPSEPRSHTILAHTPMEAWKELIFRLTRFGHRVHLGGSKERIELQTVKIIIQNPLEETADVLKEHGFSLEEFLAYQKSMLSPDHPADQEYGYGNRLRNYFGDPSSNRDTLNRAIAMLRDNAESRHVYIALWDTRRDFLAINKGHPCLVSLFFRKFEGNLTLTAVFRTHNALRAWPENVYGLMAIQRYVCRGIAHDPGAITVFSHSISIDPQGDGLERAKAICQFRNQEWEGDERFNPDPHGEFLISVDEVAGVILVDHRFEGQHLHRYTGDTAQALERMLVADLAVSDVAHALYLGRELARAEARLKKSNRIKA
ncbi:MAG: hypothetical protein HQL07_19435 [Nitrospirae bacterium]|nr:hypothetical protein [Magnetococcales bacterium]HAT50507.1 hypothetical protein [Alphaproteobacteria bacterium]